MEDYKQLATDLTLFRGIGQRIIPTVKDGHDTAEVWHTQCRFSLNDNKNGENTGAKKIKENIIDL